MAACSRLRTDSLSTNIQFVQMATLDKALALLGELRSASYDAAVKDQEELQAFVREQAWSSS